MREGVDVIYQAALRSGPWQGRADFLCNGRPAEPARRMVVRGLDTKLARETRAGTILQLCLYSDLLGDTQGVLPERIMSSRLGRTSSHRPSGTDFAAYYRLVQARSLGAVARAAKGRHLPGPGGALRGLPLVATCDRRRRDDDHLCLVAGHHEAPEQSSRPGASTRDGPGRAAATVARRPQRGRGETYSGCATKRGSRSKRRTGEPRYELLPL